MNNMNNHPLANYGTPSSVTSRIIQAPKPTFSAIFFTWFYGNFDTVTILLIWFYLLRFLWNLYQDYFVAYQCDLIVRDIMAVTALCYFYLYVYRLFRKCLSGPFVLWSILWSIVVMFTDVYINENGHRRRYVADTPGAWPTLESLCRKEKHGRAIRLHRIKQTSEVVPQDPPQVTPSTNEQVEQMEQEEQVSPPSPVLLQYTSRWSKPTRYATNLPKPERGSRWPHLDDHSCVAQPTPRWSQSTVSSTGLAEVLCTSKGPQLTEHPVELQRTLSDDPFVELSEPKTSDLLDDPIVTSPEVASTTTRRPRLTRSQVTSQEVKRATKRRQLSDPPVAPSELKRSPKQPRLVKFPFTLTSFENIEQPPKLSDAPVTPLNSQPDAGSQNDSTCVVGPDTVYNSVGRTNGTQDTIMDESVDNISFCDKENFERPESPVVKQDLEVSQDLGLKQDLELKPDLKVKQELEVKKSTVEEDLEFCTLRIELLSLEEVQLDENNGIDDTFMSGDFKDFDVGVAELYHNQPNIADFDLFVNYNQSAHFDEHMTDPATAQHDSDGDMTGVHNTGASQYIDLSMSSAESFALQQDIPEDMLNCLTMNPTPAQYYNDYNVNDHRALNDSSMTTVQTAAAAYNSLLQRPISEELGELPDAPPERHVQFAGIDQGFTGLPVTNVKYYERDQPIGHPVTPYDRSAFTVYRDTASNVLDSSPPSTLARKLPRNTNPHPMPVNPVQPQEIDLLIQGLAAQKLHDGRKAPRKSTIVAPTSNVPKTKRTVADLQSDFLQQQQQQQQLQQQLRQKEQLQQEQEQLHQQQEQPRQEQPQQQQQATSLTFTGTFDFNCASSEFKTSRNAAREAADKAHAARGAATRRKHLEERRKEREAIAAQEQEQEQPAQSSSEAKDAQSPTFETLEASETEGVEARTAQTPGLTVPENVQAAVIDQLVGQIPIDPDLLLPESYIAKPVTSTVAEPFVIPSANSLADPFVVPVVDPILVPALNLPGPVTSPLPAASPDGSPGIGPQNVTGSDTSMAAKWGAIPLASLSKKATGKLPLQLRAPVASPEQGKKSARDIEREAKQARREAALKQRAIAVEAPEKVVIIRALTDDVKEQVEHALQYDQKTRVLTPKTSFTRHDLSTLLPGPNEGIGWLNDAVIESFLNLVVDRAHQNIGWKKENKNTIPPKYHTCNPALYKTFQKDGFKKIASWLTRARVGGPNLLQAKRIFVPINGTGTHWTLLSISGTEKKVEYFDSLGGSSQKYHEFAKELLEGTLGDSYDHAAWTYGPAKSTKQTNGVDCGVFVCVNALALTAGLVPEEAVNAKHMQAARWMIAGALLTGVFPEDCGL